MLEKLFNVITSYSIHYTKLYDEEGHFQFLRQWAQQQSPPPLRFWSAACSSGEEVYSLAMLLSDVLPQANWQLHGSDLCRHALQTALAAVYPLSRTEAIPEAWKKRYRITSYNVCYTKLLRHASVAGGGADLDQSLAGGD